METIIKFIRSFANLDNSILETESPFLEIDGGFIMLNPNSKEVRDADKNLSEDNPIHSVNQSSFSGFGASLRKMS
jgi:hypothetical protein